MESKLLSTQKDWLVWGFSRDSLDNWMQPSPIWNPCLARRDGQLRLSLTSLEFPSYILENFHIASLSHCLVEFRKVYSKLNGLYTLKLFLF